jgi:hypothetical protein
MAMQFHELAKQIESASQEGRKGKTGRRVAADLTRRFGDRLYRHGLIPWDLNPNLEERLASIRQRTQEKISTLTQSQKSEVDGKIREGYKAFLTDFMFRFKTKPDDLLFHVDSEEGLTHAKTTFTQIFSRCLTEEHRGA